MRHFILLALIGFAFGISPIATAQTDNPALDAKFKAIEGLSRAKNLARQAAETANGGLEQYRAELRMHGNSAQSPYVDRDDMWVFTFAGGAPGSDSLTIETEVQVAKADFQTTVVYNGAVRSTSP